MSKTSSDENAKTSKSKDSVNNEAVQHNQTDPNRIDNAVPTTSGDSTKPANMKIKKIRKHPIKQKAPVQATKIKKKAPPAPVIASSSSQFSD